MEYKPMRDAASGTFKFCSCGTQKWVEELYVLSRVLWWWFLLHIGDKTCPVPCVRLEAFLGPGLVVTASGNVIREDTLWDWTKMMLN